MSEEFEVNIEHTAGFDVFNRDNTQFDIYEVKTFVIDFVKKNGKRRSVEYTSFLVARGHWKNTVVNIIRNEFLSILKTNLEDCKNEKSACLKTIEKLCSICTNIHGGASMDFVLFNHKTSGKWLTSIGICYTFVYANAKTSLVSQTHDYPSTFGSYIRESIKEGSTTYEDRSSTHFTTKDAEYYSNVTHMIGGDYLKVKHEPYFKKLPKDITSILIGTKRAFENINIDEVFTKGINVTHKPSAFSQSETTYIHVIFKNFKKTVTA